jgi:hypothetical protein
MAVRKVTAMLHKVNYIFCGSVQTMDLLRNVTFCSSYIAHYLTLHVTLFSSTLDYVTIVASSIKFNYSSKLEGVRWKSLSYVHYNNANILELL